MHTAIHNQRLLKFTHPNTTLFDYSQESKQNALIPNNCRAHSVRSCWVNFGKIMLIGCSWLTYLLYFCNFCQ